MKTRAPPPPAAPQPAPRRIFRNAVPDGGGSPGGDAKENMPRAAVDLHITLPNGYQTTVTMDGRKALMDVLVDLCGQYHLNPAYHTLELLSPDAQTVPFKPNAPLGSLDVTCALIKERVVEERVVRKPPPKVPEKTVRLVVNYLRGQKAVVRVSPLVPLQSLVPAICQKCEFDPAHVLLLRDSISNHELDLRKSLSELEIRELYVLDQTLAESLRSNTQSSSVSEKKSILGFFKFNRRKSKSGEMFSEDMDEGDDSVMQSTEPCVNGLSVGSGACVEVRPNTLGQSQSAMNLSRLSPKPEPKKRRAPAPPPPPTHTTHAAAAEESRTTPGSPRLDSQLRKRKAPPPPATPTPTPTCSTPEPPPTVPVAVVHVPAVHVPAQVPVRRTLPAPALDDSSLSDLSHSVEDSEPARSVCSSSSSDIAVESATSSLAEEPMDPLTDKRPAISTPVLEPEPEPKPVAAYINTAKRDNPSSVPESPSSVKEEEEMESPLEFKMEEMENNRHSGIAWLHPAERRVDQEVETVSMCSSGSFADQGYAASEGMADDSVLLSSPSDMTQPTSLDDSISLGHEPSPVPTPCPAKDCSSDSDEGCATWGSQRSCGESGLQSSRREESYEEDADITAQIHLTLADLDADLAEGNHSDEASVCVEDKIPVSVVDVDIPVTAIDEVPVDDRPSMNAFEAALLRSIQKMDDDEQRVSVNTNKPSLDVRNKNNNARVSEEAGIDQTGEDRIQTLRSKKQTEKVTSPDIKAEIRLEKTNVHVPERLLSPPVCPRVQSAQSTPENKLRPPPLVRSHSMEDPQMERASYSKAPTTAQVKIAQNPVSRFGLKTFTVIPPKPAVSNSPKPAGSLRTGAIKIDELGNMVNQREVRPASAISVHPDDTNSDPDSPLLCKAKAFWSSAEKQDSAPAPVPNQDISLKTIEAIEMPKSAPTTVILEVPPKPSTEEHPKVTIPAPTVVDKPAPSDSVENSSVSFFKPSRRTSSQYVASAIAKYTVNPSTKADGIPAISETKTDGRTQLASRGVKHEIRSLHSVTNHKESNAFAERVSYFAGPKRSQSCPSQAVEKQTPIVELKFTGTSRGFKSLDSSPVINKSHQQTQSPTCSEPAQSSSKETTSTKVSPGNSVSGNRPTDSARPPVPKKPDIHSPGVLPEPHQVTVFGPVKKFKPVMLRSVEKESSLHSSLMEAIQSGEGIGQLRKVSDSRTSTLKKPSYVEAENEHSALLSAIRAHSNTTRLKKTKSEAAVELEEFRKVEEDQSIQRDVTSPPPPPAFQPPPALNIPPPPPPPPAPTAPAKPALVLPAGGNPELAREALLEAIRSGSGAERLRKVPVANKTVKVNGRLGTIQTSLPQKR